MTTFRRDENIKENKVQPKIKQDTFKSKPAFNILLGKLSKKPLKKELEDRANHKIF